MGCRSASSKASLIMGDLPVPGNLPEQLLPRNAPARPTLLPNNPNPGNELVDYPYGPAPPRLLVDPDLTEAGRWLLLPLGTICALADFFIAPLCVAFSDDWGLLVVFACIGVILAEGGLLAALVAWGAGLFRWRLAVHWALAAVGYSMWALGLAWCSGKTEFLEEVSIALLVLPLASLAIQAPLWIARQLFAWRLVKGDAGASSSPEPPLSITAAMAGTIVVAVAFGYGRNLDTGDSEFWVGFGIMTALLTGLSTLAVLPVSVLILRLPHVKSGLIATGSYAVLAIALVWGIGCSIVSASAPSAWTLAYLSVAIITGGGTLALAAVATRAWGWRLVIGHGRRLGGCPTVM
jgi:hypothetical protein